MGSVEIAVNVVTSAADCGRKKPLGKREYLEIYNFSNDTQDLGKVAAEAAIRWPGS